MRDLEKQYKKQGLGGYEDEESLDNSIGRAEWLIYLKDWLHIID